MEGTSKIIIRIIKAITRMATAEADTNKTGGVVVALTNKVREEDSSSRSPRCLRKLLNRSQSS
jgi:hypothetical protein